MKKVILFLLVLLVNISVTNAQSIGGTNTLSSKTNIQYQLNYEYKTGGSGGAFTNTVPFKTPTNAPWIKLYKNDETNSFYFLIGTNDNIYLGISNSISGAHFNLLNISNDVSENFAIWSDFGIELGKTPDMGTPAKRWRVHGINSLFDGATYGFMSPTNITIAAINVSGNSDTVTTFANPNVTIPGMYEIGCNLAVTQTCVGATMQVGIVCSNFAGFQTNWLFQHPVPLTALTNVAGSTIVSNINLSLAYDIIVKNYGSATALGYYTLFVRQLQ